MDISKIIFLVSTGIFFVLFFTIPFRVRNLKKNAGECILKLTQASVYKAVFIYLAGFLLIIFTMLIKFYPLYQCIFCLCALLGENIAMREFIMSGKYGVYENGIIASTQFVRFSDILSFPVLELPTEERERYNPCELSIVSKSKSNITLIFASKEECEKVTKIAREKTAL